MLVKIQARLYEFSGSTRKICDQLNTTLVHFKPGFEIITGTVKAAAKLAIGLEIRRRLGTGAASGQQIMIPIRCVAGRSCIYGDYSGLSIGRGVVR
jgi:hypothetical protein